MISPGNIAQRLLLDGAITLADVSAAGIRVNAEYCRRTEEELKTKAEILKQVVLTTILGQAWQARYGAKTNIGSGTQLSKVLYEDLKIPVTSTTEKGNPSVDIEALTKCRVPGVAELLELRKVEKTKGTYLKGIAAEEVDGLIHPSFNLHTVRTYRSSCNDPNFQNLPVRDVEIMRLVRRAIIPRAGRQLLEIDYKGIEVRVAACYHQDPGMLAYIEDPTKDMHRDMATQIFKLPEGQCTKQARFAAKNGFVFPEFYGDYWKRCAQSMWEMIDTLKLARVDGTPMREHLRAAGISSLVAFERHMESVEKDFWGRRFPAYAAWKETWWLQYQERGYMDTLTGFRCSGLIGRNDCINYPVQGSAFHCLLWSLIRLHRWLRTQKKQTQIIAQIHDSIVMDTAPDEAVEVLAIARRIMCEDIRRVWPWIITPLEIEAEIAPVDCDWSTKKEWKP